MPQGMSKRSLNTTQYRPKTDLILWRVHVVFIINNNFTSAMLLKPENQNGQNANFGEYSSSSSSMSITGVKLLFVLCSCHSLSCYMTNTLTITLTHTHTLMYTFTHSPLFSCHLPLHPPLKHSEETLVTTTLPAMEETKVISDILADFLTLRPGNSTIRHALRSLRPDRLEQTRLVYPVCQRVCVCVCVS